MNIYMIIILATLLITYIIKLVSNILNIKSLDPVLPEEFKDVFDKEKYRKSQEYTKVKTKFGLINSTYQLIITIAFWFLGGFNWLDLIVRGWGFHPIISGLIYIGILVFALDILDIPFDIYDTFVIEEKFGFNKTTPKTFVMDKLKAYMLMIIIGGLVLSGIMAFFQYAGAFAWVYCWIAVAIFSIFMIFVAPTWIMPLFNKFTPLEDGELKTAILDYMDKVKFPLKGLFVMDGSKRSSKSNAFFTGFGKNKRIALFDTLIERHTIDELVAVLAHEVGHYKKKHVYQMLFASILQMGIIFYLLSIFVSKKALFDAFMMENTSIYAGLIFFGMLYSPISFILKIFMVILSRKNEYEADRFASETTKQPEALISALKKLSANNLGNLTPHPFYVFINYDHPPVLERIWAMRKLKL